jgi:hypothetical protein
MRSGWSSGLRHQTQENTYSKKIHRGDWSILGHRVKRDSEGKNRKYQLIGNFF